MGPPAKPIQAPEIAKVGTAKTSAQVSEIRIKPSGIFQTLVNESIEVRLRGPSPTDWSDCQFGF